ncbi:MAG: hypothetical protein A2284_10605 [Deltaproteobacteria bacterium RIFOXYA12_FULL_61_11]|nr:MAG: hypothetical protein A2284_10605 [Deltaproteobacteria bacterium RIFOXYA12_FULL_61_11]
MKKKNIEKLTKEDGASPNVVAVNIERLRDIFPEVFADGSVDFDALKETLGEYVDDREERYSFTWHGKARARQIAQMPSTGTLRPCPEESVYPFLVEGFLPDLDQDVPRFLGTHYWVSGSIEPRKGTLTIGLGSCPEHCKVVTQQCRKPGAVGETKPDQQIAVTSASSSIPCRVVRFTGFPKTGQQGDGERRVAQRKLALLWGGL